MEFRGVNDSCSRMYFCCTWLLGILEGIALNRRGVGVGGPTMKGRKWGFPRKFVTKDNSTVWNIIFHSDDFTVIEYGD